MVNVIATCFGYEWTTSATGPMSYSSRTLFEVQVSALRVIEEATGRPVTHRQTTFNVYRPA